MLLTNSSTQQQIVNKEGNKINITISVNILFKAHYHSILYPQFIQMRSTLPDLFKADLDVIKFHPQDRPKKIGGRFTIKLNTHHTLQSSPEKSPRQLRKLESSVGFTRSIYQGGTVHARSQSIHQLAPALKQDSLYGNKSINRGRKAVNFINDPTYISTRDPSLSSLSREIPTLQQIFIQNTMKNKAISSHAPGYGFPYETTRSMNNMKIEMEQADSFKNRVQTMVKDQAQNQNTLSQIIKQTSHIKQSLVHFKQAYLEDLQVFDEDFRSMCKNLMKGLSLTRRQTGQQTKINEADTERLYYEYKDSGAILNLLEDRTNLLRDECIEDDKIQLTNSKTYTQDLHMRIYQSQKQTQLDKLFKRTKRSGTSQDYRAPTSHSMRIATARLSSRNLFLKDRAQTTEIPQRRLINGQANAPKEDDQELIYEEQHPNQREQNETGKQSKYNGTPQSIDELRINTKNQFKNDSLLSYEQQIISDY